MRLSRIATLGALMLGGILCWSIAGCRQLSAAQQSELTSRYLHEEQRKVVPEVPAAVEQAARSLMTVGWADQPGVSRGNLQSVILRQQLHTGSWRAALILGREPQSTADLLEAGVLFVSPAAPDDAPLAYSSDATAAGVLLHWTPQILQFEVRGAQGPAMSDGMPPRGHIDLGQIRKARALDAQHGWERGKPSSRERQDVLIRTIGESLLMFVTHHGRFPESYEELLQFFSLRAIGFGVPLAPAQVPGPNALLLEVSEGEREVRWRTLGQDLAPRIVGGIGFDEHYQPGRLPSKEPVRIVSQEDHSRTAGWRTLAAFQF